MRTKKQWYIRAVEIVPGALTWITFLAPIVLAFYIPKVVSLTVMIYAMYWLFKTLVMSRHLIWGYRNYRAAEKVEWQKELDIAHRGTWREVQHLVLVPMY